MLKIQTYLKEHGIDKTLSNLKLIYKDYGHKFLLKYNQIESDFSIQEVKECRGLILKKYTYDILSMNFIKFFNHGEQYANKIDWNAETRTVTIIKGETTLKLKLDSDIVLVNGKEYKIEEKFISERLYIGVRDKVKMADMHAFFEKNFGVAMDFVNSSGLTMAGMPSGLYWEFDETKGISDMAAAIPIEAIDETKPIAMRVDSDIRFFTIPANANLVINYYGPYEGIGEAHVAMDNYIAAKGYTMVAPAIEEYVTDPGTEPDPNKWLTVLYYPVKR